MQSFKGQIYPEGIPSIVLLLVKVAQVTALAKDGGDGFFGLNVGQQRPAPSPSA